MKKSIKSAGYSSSTVCLILSRWSSWRWNMSIKSIIYNTNVAGLYWIMSDSLGAKKSPSFVKMWKFPKKERKTRESIHFGLLAVFSSVLQFLLKKKTLFCYITKNIQFFHYILLNFITVCCRFTAQVILQNKIKFIFCNYRTKSG